MILADKLMMGVTIALVLMIGFNVHFWYDSNENYKDLISELQRSKLYGEQVGLDTQTQGIYFQNQYYCVWTEGRTEEAINKTESHEKCHALINWDAEHFCKE